MNNEKTKKIIKAIIAIGIGLVSFLLLSKQISFDTLLSSCIRSLHALEADLQALIVFVKDQGETLYEIPDLAYGVTASFDTMAPLLIVILGAVYFVQILLSYAAEIVFFLLIPLACIHYLIFLIKNNPIQKRKIFKGILWITVLLLILPVIVSISKKIEQTPAYSSVETSMDEATDYYNNNSALNATTTQDEAISLIKHYLKVFGLLFLTRFLLPIILVVIYMKIMQTLFMKIPFISKQLELPEPVPIVEPVEAVENEEAELPSDDIITEEEQAEREEKEKLARKKYKRNRLIRRIVILAVLIGIIFGFKTGAIKLPDNAKKVLIGTSVPFTMPSLTRF